ncbi:MAG: hypothetical protein MJ211_14225 [Bacteroidales bacterium]|nr:hypothetical protein [Bacteroidales bacterium]
MKKICNIIFLLSFIVISQNIFAQDFEVSPVDLNFNTLPNNIQNKKITITNHSNESAIFKISTQDYTFNELGEKELKARDSHDFSCSLWMAISPNVIEIEPNSQGEITVSMNVPEDGWQTRWCDIIISQTQEQTSFIVDNTKQAGINLLSQIMVYVTQKPENFYDNKAEIVSFVDSGLDENNNKTLTAIVENKGKDIINGKIYLALANIDDLSEQDILPQQVKIYPQCSRKFKFTLNQGILPNGTYDVSTILDLGKRAPLIGARLKDLILIAE